MTRRPLYPVGGKDADGIAARYEVGGTYGSARRARGAGLAVNYGNVDFFVGAFDDAGRLVSVQDGEGRELHRSPEWHRKLARAAGVTWAGDAL